MFVVLPVSTCASRSAAQWQGQVQSESRMHFTFEMPFGEVKAFGYISRVHVPRAVPDFSFTRVAVHHAAENTLSNRKAFQMQSGSTAYRAHTAAHGSTGSAV